MYMAARNLLKIKRALQEIWVAATKIAAEAAFDAFVSNETALAMALKLVGTAQRA